MEEVGEDDVEVEEAVRLTLLLGGVGSGDVDGEVEVCEGTAGGGEEGVEGVLVGRHRDEPVPGGGGGGTRWRGGSRRVATYLLTGGGPLSHEWWWSLPSGERRRRRRTRT